MKDLNQLLTVRPIGQAEAEASQRMFYFSLRQQRAENCYQIGSTMYGWMAGTGTLLHIGGLRELHR